MASCGRWSDSSGVASCGRRRRDLIIQRRHRRSIQPMKKGVIRAGKTRIAHSVRGIRNVPASLRKQRIPAVNHSGSRGRTVRAGSVNREAEDDASSTRFAPNSRFYSRRQSAGLTLYAHGNSRQTQRPSHREGVRPPDSTSTAESWARFFCPAVTSRRASSPRTSWMCSSIAIPRSGSWPPPKHRSLWSVSLRA